MPPHAGPELEGYTWERALGAGGFADVHLYRQRVPNREVAVKVVRSAQDRRGVDVLAREADAMAAVSGHPAVASLYSVGTTTDGRPYLAMEYCPVSDVGDQVRERPMAVARALDLVIQVCGGVEALHRAGWAHRDIKPSNVLLTAFGRPALGDFGVAARIGAAEPGAPDGFSVLWAPPEQQVAGAAVHPTQDVWALGTTLWTFLTGRSPFEDPLGDNSPVAIAARVQEGRLRRLTRPDIPGDLEDVLRATLRVDPRKRPASAAELGQRLQSVQERMGLPVTRMEVTDSADGRLDSAPTGVGTAGGDEADRDRTTRLRGAPSIDPGRTRVRGHAWATDHPEADRDGSASPGDHSVPAADLRAAIVDWSDPVPVGGEVREPRRVRPWAVVLLAAVAVVAAAGLAVAVLTGGGEIVMGEGTAPSGSVVDPADPVGRAPDPVVGLSGVEREGRIYWTWRAGGAEGTAEGGQSGPAPQPGADDSGTPPAEAPSSMGQGEQPSRYVTTLTQPGRDPVTRDTVQAAIDTGAASGSNCLEVTALGEQGRPSTPVSVCVDVP